MKPDPQTSDKVLQVAELRKSFDGTVQVVNGIDFSIDRGEIVSLLGPSGCGKTTILRLIAGFERADEGSVLINGNTVCDNSTHIPPEKRGVGVVFQDFALFPNLSVLDNVAFGLRGLSADKKKARALEAISLVGLRGFESRMPHQLSGGQQQRVAIARTLAPRPQLVLMDEPFSNLDALLRTETRHDIREVFKAAGTTVLLVTHDQEEALSFSDRVGLMWNGRIEQIGTPEEIYYRPKTLFSAQFLGRTNLILSDATGMTASTPIGEIALDRDASGTILVSLRPEHLSLAPAKAAEADSVQPGPIEGSVIDREFRGHDVTYRISIEGSDYLVHTDNRKLFEPGDAVFVKATEPAVVLQKY